MGSVFFPKFAPWFWLGAAFCFVFYLGNLWGKRTQWKQARHHLGALETIKVNGSNLPTFLDEIEVMDKQLKASERHNQEMVQAAKNSLHFLNQILDKVSNGVLILNAERKVIYFNRALAELLDMEGAKLNEVYVEELIQVSPVLDFLAAETEKGEPRVEEVSFFNLGTEKNLRLISFYLTENEKDRRVMLAEDISSLKHMQRVEKDLISNVSHELKTPLTAISGYIDILQAGTISKLDQTKFLGRIQTNLDSLITLVNNLVNFSYEEDQSADGRQNVDINVIIDDTLSLFEHRFFSLGIEKHILLEEGTLWVRGAGQDIKQILRNLLDNAIKYRNQKDPNILIRSRSLADLDMVEVMIQDNGMGIPKHEIKRIFERFYRVDKVRTDQIDGTGIGLSIVKTLVERIGGSIRVDSVVGEKTIFYLNFPMGKK